jgi:hypothetical protein
MAETGLLPPPAGGELGTAAHQLGVPRPRRPPGAPRRSLAPPHRVDDELGARADGGVGVGTRWIASRPTAPGAWSSKASYSREAGSRSDLLVWPGAAWRPRRMAEHPEEPRHRGAVVAPDAHPHISLGGSDR